MPSKKKHAKRSRSKSKNPHSKRRKGRKSKHCAKKRSAALCGCSKVPKSTSRHYKHRSKTSKKKSRRRKPQISTSTRVQSQTLDQPQSSPQQSSQSPSTLTSPSSAQQQQQTRSDSVTSTVCKTTSSKPSVSSSTQTSNNTNTSTPPTKDMDEVEVEADGAFDYPRQSFVIRKYCSGGRTIRYFDHQMSHPINDRPLTFFPPTIKKFLTYQKRLKAVPLKKQDEGKMGYTDAIIYNKDDKTITTNMQDLKNSLMASKSFIQQLKGRVDKITPEIRQCAADMDSGINQMTQLFSRINTAKQ